MEMKSKREKGRRMKRIDGKRGRERMKKRGGG